MSANQRARVKSSIWNISLYGNSQWNCLFHLDSVVGVGHVSVQPTSQIPAVHTFHLEVVTMAVDNRQSLMLTQEQMDDLKDSFSTVSISSLIRFNIRAFVAVS